MKSAIAVGMSAAVLAGLLSAAPVLSAERFGDGGGRRLTVDRRQPMHGRIVDGTMGTPRRFNSQVPGQRPFAPNSGSSFGPNHGPNHGPDHGPNHGPNHGFPRHRHGVIASSPIVYYSPGYFDSGSTYADPPSDYAPAPAYGYAPMPTVSIAPAPPAPPAPPTPTVVEHPTGRYELRGDGVATPYTWVWVPNPPPAPPAPPTAGGSGEVRRSSLYKWTDREGVVHWTDNANLVPEEYRGKVQKRSL